jgi:FMN phosphatase YigB (HAD superfamily)
MVRDRYGLRTSVDGLVERFYQELPGCIPPPDPGSRQALIRARDHGWRLCIVTNGGPVQRAKIETAGLVDLVDGVIISQEVWV